MKITITKHVWTLADKKGKPIMNRLEKMFPRFWKLKSQAKSSRVACIDFRLPKSSRYRFYLDSHPIRMTVTTTFETKPRTAIGYRGR
jgi:hypothetical protein